jgi:hypothetical protein
MGTNQFASAKPMDKEHTTVETAKAQIISSTGGVFLTSTPLNADMATSYKHSCQGSLTKR